mgnify:CR=1 FL=1
MLADSIRDFWSHVGRWGECWPYSTAYAYGTVRWRGHQRAAHRVAWELTYGPIPEGLLVLHRCDNRPCVNPAHLFLGTYRDNTRDYYEKARTGTHHPFGEIPSFWERPAPKPGR